MSPGYRRAQILSRMVCYGTACEFQTIALHESSLEFEQIPAALSVCCQRVTSWRKFFGWRQMISNLICLAAPMLHMPCSCASQAVLLAQQLILSHPSCQLEQSAGTIMLPLSEERGCFGFCCLIGAWHVPRAGETWRCCGHGLRWAVGQSVNQADTRRGECIDSYVRIAL